MISAAVRIGNDRVRAYRRRLWRLGQVKNESQFRQVLQRVGLCLIFGSDDVPLPKVYDVAHDDADGWWNWKDHLQAKRQAYMGRLIRGKATLVTMDLLPAFLALYYEQGGTPSYDEEHYYSRITQQAKWICDYLDRHGPCPADELRKAMKTLHGIGTAAYHKALLELQRKFKVVTAGLVERTSWGARVIGLFEQWVPDPVERRARKLMPEQARVLILRSLLKTAGAVPAASLDRITGWPKDQVTQAVETLYEKNLVRREICPRRKQRDWIVWHAL